MAAMSTEETFKFIELYQAENCIWNPNNKNHKNKNIVNDAWKRIADSMGVPVHELKKKKESLMTSFRTNLKKKLSSLKSGAGEEDAYKPIWIFYESMEVFLKNIYERSSLANTQQNIHPHSDHESVDNDEFTLGGETVQTGDDPTQTGNGTPIVASENENRLTSSVHKRRAKNPAELQEAGKQMSIAFKTLNRMLQTKQNKEEDDCDLFGRLLATKLREYPKAEREEIMYEIHGLMINKRRHYERMMKPTSYSASSSPSSGSVINSSYSAEPLSQTLVNHQTLSDVHYQSPDNGAEVASIVKEEWE